MAAPANAVCSSSGCRRATSPKGGAAGRWTFRPSSLTCSARSSTPIRTVVVVLSNGAAVTVADWAERVRAILEGWLLGQGGGAALADLLFGVANPSGRLTETIPWRLADNPSFGNFPGEFGVVRYGEGVLVGYRSYDARDVAVAYPFGHGLSYTSFEYGPMTATVSGSAPAGTSRSR